MFSFLNAGWRLLFSILLWSALSLPLHANPPAAERMGIPDDVSFTLGSLEIKGADGIHLQQASIARISDERWAFQLKFSKTPQFLFHNLSVNINLDNSAKTGQLLSGRPGTDLHLRVNKDQVTTNFAATEIDTAKAWAVALQDGANLWIVCELPGFPLEEAPRVRLYSRIRGNGAKVEDAIQMTTFTKVAPQLSSDLPRPELANWQLVQPPDAYAAIHSPEQRLHSDVNQASRKHGIFYPGKENRGLTPDELPIVNVPPLPRAVPLPEEVGRASAPARSPQLEGWELPVISITNELPEQRNSARVRFGLPLPKGAVTSPEQIALVCVGGGSINAHQQSISRWNEGSIRSLLFDFESDFAAHEKQSFQVIVSEKGQLPTDDLLLPTPNGWKIETAGGSFELKKSLFSPISRDTGQPLFPQGVILEDDSGNLYSTAHASPRRVSLEERTPTQATFRLEGSYTSRKGVPFMSYVTRFTFNRHSRLIQITHTHINTELSHEFSDLQRLELPLGKAVPDGALKIGGIEDSRKLTALRTDAVRQWDDRQYQLAGGSLTSGRMSGAFQFLNSSGGISGWISEAWQRWPKGIREESGRITLELLPVLPHGDFGTDLPIHLRFPFVSNSYRLKWGTAFTERLALDFTGATDLASASAEAQWPLVAIIPAQWYAQTHAFGPIAMRQTPLLQRWDKFFDHSFQEHERRRHRQREYGFLNYGDWFGERARNWGNNEYDTAHAFFVQFMRSGRPEYFRAGIAAARHQADVDILHAYPDPSVVGGNILHGVGHSGTASHLIPYGTTSAPMHVSTSPDNGHTWSEGMVEAWWLTGDAVCMESALKLAENMCWVFAPIFKSGEKIAPRKAGWALRALSRFYEATGDQAYKQAAQTIALGVIPFQDSATGAWFWDVPLRWAEIHEKRKATSPGAQTWQLGILLAGMRCYWESTGDPLVLEPMEKLAGFLMRSWKKNGGWPYITTPDGGAHPSRPNFNIGMNAILTQGLAPLPSADSGEIRERTSLVHSALFQLFDAHSVKAAGQQIGYTLRDVAVTIGMLEAVEAESAGTQTPATETSRGLSGSPVSRE